MYYYISGILAYTSPGTAVVDAGGIGYEMSISGNTLSKLSGKTGSVVKLFTYLSVREDAMELYGFYSEEEKETFEMLITVSGVGPKAAMAILSVLSPERLSTAIISGDVKSISLANGVGSKTAARVVLELKDKISKVVAPEQGAEMFAEQDNGSPSAVSDAIAVLLSLGYTRQEALFALRGSEPSADAETLVRNALKKLMKN
ncbi:MAG: Holliday junction branch migration protein RuvA [Clostridia bacterium]|nr:Holliday junction branch migration protein RuvA [Clostridia bacterium]